MTIRNDATRLLLRPADPRRPRQVVPRQGQVLLDADIDQQAGLALSRIETGSADMLGSPGRLVVPNADPGFAVTAAATPDACGLAAGHGYLGGWLVENATACTLATQPHPRSDTTPVAPVLIALKALVRHVDPVEEPAWADHGLGDAQAAGRALIDWQAFPFAPAAGWGAGFGCASATTDPAWLALTAPSTGTLKVIKAAAGGGTDPCSLTPAGGFTRGENLLYRIEVHGGVKRADLPDAAGARYGLNGLRLKLSRRNASVLVRITGISGAEITVEPPALDPLNWFAPGLHAEFVSLHDDVDPPDPALAERLFRVAQASDEVVTLEAAASGFAAGIAGQPGWFLRLWDAFPGLAAPGSATVSTAGHPSRSQIIDLGDGLSMELAGGAQATFRRGDFWTFAARSDGFVDWPDGQAEPPHGPEIRFAPLAALTPPAGAPLVEDCRIPAASLTDRALLYRGGDGQAIPRPEPAPAFVDLPTRLRVAVMRGRNPVTGATVRWSVPAGRPGCQIDGAACGPGTVDSITGADGLCEVIWALSSATADPLHQVEAQILAADGSVEPQPVRFTAGFRSAAQTSFHPGACALLNGVTDVQNAIDTLCLNLGGSTEPDTLILDAITLVSKNRGATDLLKERLILNGDTVPFDAFDLGIGFGIAGPALESKPEAFDPIVEVELDLPYPITDPDRVYWATASRPPGKPPEITGAFGFQRVRLDGAVQVLRKASAQFPRGIAWVPSAQARNFLLTLPLHLGGQLVGGQPPEAGWKGDPVFDRLLCRLRLRSAHLWATDKETGKRIWLNAEHLGTSEGATGRELMVDERDPQRAADLDMFFYLAVKPG